MEYVRVRNWERYQVYKDGRPMKFFRVETSILDDPSFCELANDTACPVFRVMAYAARTGNKIPNDPKWLQAALHLNRAPNIEKMLNAGFLEIENGSVQNRTDSYLEEKRIEEKRTPPDPPEGEAVVRLFEHWKVVRGRDRARLTDGRRRKLKARLKTFPEAELIRALDAVALDPWEERHLHDDIDKLFKNDEAVERWLRMADNPPKKSLSADDIERLMTDDAA